MKKIPVFGGHFALVDDCNFKRLSKHSWHLTGGKNRYVEAAIKMPNGKYRHFKMARIVMGVFDSSILVDHKKGDLLDNRKSELRRCSRSQNGRAFRIKRVGTSKFRGVTWNKTEEKWMVGIRIHLGYFKSEKKAALAYDKKAIELFGEFASPNFPI